MAASTGTLIAAAMETGGYKAQELVLSQLGSFITSLSLLFLVAFFIIAVFVFVVSGNTDRIIWFFVGPAIFLFLTQSTITGTGVDWQFGTFKSNQTLIQQTTGITTPSNVSWAFHKYNQFVSAVVQTFVAVLTNDPVRDQLIFTNRQRIMDKVLSAEIKNPGLKALINIGLQGECREFSNAARIIGLSNRNLQTLGTSEHQQALMDYKRVFYQKSNKLDGNAVAQDYLEKDVLTVWKKDLSKTNAFIDKYCGDKLAGSGIDGDGKGALKEDFSTRTPTEVVNSPMSCQQIWCWSWMGLHNDAEALMTLAGRSITEYDDKSGGEFLAKRSAVMKEVWDDISVKFQKIEQAPMIPEDQLPGGVPAYTPTTPDVSLIPVVLGGLMLRKELVKDPQNDAASTFAERSGVETKQFNASLHMSDEETAFVSERRSQRVQAFAMQHETFALAMMLPYFQGFFLYFLALIFPFVAMLALIPSRVGGVVQWFAAWAWVKSWDVGWAMVMAIDEVYWQLMPHGSMYSMTRDRYNSPTTIMESAFSGDPTYSLSTYYAILGVLLLAVPTVSAKLFIKAHSGVSGFFMNGAQEMSRYYGNGAANWEITGLAAEADFLKNMEDARYVSDALQAGAPAIPKIQELLNRSHAIEGDASSWWKTAGMVGIGGIGAGTVLGLAGGGPLGLAVVAAAGGGSQLLLERGVRGEQLGNEVRAAMLPMASKLWYYDTNHQKAQMTLRKLNAAVNGRVGSWFMVDGSNATEQFQKLRIQQPTIEGRVNYLDGKVKGGLVGTAVSAGAGMFGVTK